MAAPYLTTLYHPTTRKTRVVDISGGTSEVMALYKAGWRPYSTSPQQTRQIITQAQQHQRRLDAWAAAPTVPPQQRSTPLTKYVKDGQINLADLWTQKDYYAINYAKGVYGDDALDRAKTVSDLTTREPILVGDFMKLPEAERDLDKYRFLSPTSLNEFNEMGELEKASHYIESKGVGSGIYKRMGSGTRKIFHAELNAWEKLTPWKEEEGQTGTTKNILLWEAEVAVPFVYVARHWDEISNPERAFHLLLDCVFVGALTAKPLSKALGTAAGSLTRKGVGNTGSRVIMNEIKALDRAVVVGDRLAIQRAGARLQSLGEIMKKQGVVGAQQLINKGKFVKTKAGQIAAHEIKLAPQGRRVTAGLKKLAKSERGSIGKDDIKFPIPDDELAKSGLTQAELAEILDKVGDDIKLFRAEIIKRQRIKDGIWQEIKTGKEAADKAIEQKYVKPEDLGLQRAPAKAKPKTVVTTKVIEKEERKFIEEMEELLAKATAKPKPNVKHAIAYKIAQQQRKQARIIAKIAAEVAQKKAIQERIRLVVLKILRDATAAGLRAALAGKTLAQIRAAVKAAIRAHTRTLTNAEIRELTATAAMTRALTSTATRTVTATKRALAVKPLTVTKAKREVVAAPDIRPLTDLVPAPIPSPVPSPTPTPTPPPTPPPGQQQPPPGGPPPGKPKPDKTPRRRRPGSMPKRFTVKKVVGIPENAGRVSFHSGIVKVTLLPPYRPGTDDIAYTRLKKPTTGEGSQEATLRVTDGDAPSKLVLSRGIDEVTITAGKSMSHNVGSYAKGPNMLIGKKGTRQRQRRGMVI